MSSNQSNDHPLQRNAAAGMNPTSLLTGFYDTRGQRIRHVAHEGALRLPSEALSLLVSDNSNAILDDEQKKKKKFELPQIDSLDRPSEGAEFVVTDVWGEEVTVESAEGVSSKKLRTVARNRTESRGADRIRGGGGDEEEAKQEKKEPVSAGEAAAAALASATVTSAAPVDPSAAPVADSATKPLTVPAAPTVATPTIVAVVAPPVPAAAAAVAPPATVATVPAPVPAATPAPVTTVPVPAPTTTTAASAPVTATAVANPATSTSSTVGKPFPLPPVLKKAPVAATSTLSAPAAALATAAAAAAAQPAPVTTSAVPVPVAPPAATAAAAATPAPVAPPAATPATTVLPAAATAPTPAPVTSKSSIPAPAAATSTPAAPVVSSSSAPAAAAATATRPVAKAPPPQVLPLAKRPDAQWVQHMPGPNDEMAIAPNQTTPKPDWFHESQASSLERTLLPEWFDGSAPHRTPEHYVKVRQAILKLSQKLATRYVTATMVRRAIPGDAGSLMRLHHFLNTYHLINEHAMNDSAPNALPPPPLPADQKRSWDEASREQLVQAVVDEARAKRAKRAQPSDDDFVPIDWVAVSKKIPDMTPAQCEEEFLALPNLQEAAEEQETTNGNGATTMTTSSHAAVLTELLDTCDAKVRQAATKAALQATDDLGQAQRAATIGLIASRAAEISRDHQETVSNVLNELVDLRMKKLENRLAMLDDVEGMLEAERVALELERRDLYTSRCRHWFQGP